MTNFNYTIFSQYVASLGISTANIDEMSEIVDSGDVKKFKEWIGEGTVITSPGKSKSLLHYAVTCKSSKDTDTDKVTGMISAVLQSGTDINHPDEKGNTPLMHLLYEAQKIPRKDLEGLKERIKFLVEHGASFQLKNKEESTADDLLNVLINQGILDKEINDTINEAEKFCVLVSNKIKKELSKHIVSTNSENQNSIIEKATVYGHYAQIKLNSDGAELKISEFLQGNFCKDNGILGFSTFHNDEEGGMHGLLSPNGVRNYTVTDGSYNMTLHWFVNEKEYTITINIDKDGVVVKSMDGVNDEQLQANKDVTINGLSLFDAVKRGRHREREQEHIHERQINSDTHQQVSSEQINNTAELLENAQSESHLQNISVPDPSAPEDEWSSEHTDPDSLLNSHNASTPKVTGRSAGFLPDLQYTSPKIIERSDANIGQSDSGYNSSDYSPRTTHNGSLNLKELKEKLDTLNNKRDNSNEFTKSEAAERKSGQHTVSTEALAKIIPQLNKITKSEVAERKSGQHTVSTETLEKIILQLNKVSIEPAQKQDVKKPFDYALGKIQKDRKIYRWIEKQRGSITQATDGKRLGQAEGQSEISKLASKSGQKGLPTLQDSTKKDFSIIDLLEDITGLRPADRSKMSKSTKQYLFDTSTYIAPKHALKAQQNPTYNPHDQNRIGLANASHALRLLSNTQNSEKKEGRRK